jgi:orotate phosphoribosyltransferase
MSVADEVRGLLVEVGALREGHFRLTSGRHSDRFFLLARLFEHPKEGERVARLLALALRGQGSLPISTVVGPAMGGVLLAYDLARQLGARAMFAEKSEEGMRLRRGFQLAPGERVLVAEDALTTGGSVARTIEAVAAQGADVLAVATVVRRGSHEPAFTAPLVALLEDDAVDWPAEACPLCAAGSTAVAPKS